MMRRTAPPETVPVEVQIAVNQAAGLSDADLTGWAEAVLDRMGDARESVDVCIRLVDEAESEKLNARFRGRESATNVLSFPADVRLPESGRKLLGDILICDPVVRREAEIQGKALRAHFAHMVVHGMLHLYGCDHEDPAEAEEMEKLEREILNTLGIADPYLAT